MALFRYTRHPGSRPPRRLCGRALADCNSPARVVPSGRRTQTTCSSGASTDCVRKLIAAPAEDAANVCVDDERDVRDADPVAT